MRLLSLYHAACENLQAVLDEVQVHAEVEWEKVESPEEAEQACFLGSPTIRVGHQLWPAVQGVFGRS